jgi:hypothetical protein
MTFATKPVVWMPTRIHPEAFKLANELFDVITPLDTRAKNWWDYADGAVVRTGGISKEEIEKAHKLKIVSRNGTLIVRPSVLDRALKMTDWCTTPLDHSIMSRRWLRDDPRTRMRRARHNCNAYTRNQYDFRRRTMCCAYTRRITQGCRV